MQNYINYINYIITNGKSIYTTKKIRIVFNVDNSYLQCSNSVATFIC